MANPLPLPQIFRFDFGDYISMGDTFQKFLGNLNLFTLSIYNLMNGGVGFSNMQRALYRTTVTAGTTTPITFVNPLTITPSGVQVVQVLKQGATNVAITSAVTAANWFYDGRNVNVLEITGLTSGSTYNIVLEVM